jgi:Tfp pilus assembly protein PilN
MKPVEFLPERIRQQRRRRQRLVWQGCLLALCLGALVLCSYLRQEAITQVRAVALQEQERVENLAQQISMLGPLEQQMADLLIKKRIDEELGSRTDCTAVLAELGRVLPADMNLTFLEIKPVDVRQEVSPAAPAAAPAGKAPTAAPESPATITVKRIRLVITGQALSDVDVANFIGQLSACPLLEEVNMGYAKNVVVNNQPAREFQASCYLAR